jgi:hypothetical protein
MICAGCGRRIVAGQAVVAFCRGKAGMLTMTPVIYHAPCFDAKMEGPPRCRIVLRRGVSAAT